MQHPWSTIKMRTVEKPEGRQLLGLDGRIILKWILKGQDGMTWTGFFWLKTGARSRLL
jgi:hypothetical protein